MSLHTPQVVAEIARLLPTLPNEQLVELYNQLHEQDHIIYLGGDLFEHQDMVD